MSDHIEMVPSVAADLKDIFGIYITVSRIKGGIELDCGSSCTVTFQKLKRVCSYEETKISIQVLK